MVDSDKRNERMCVVCRRMKEKKLLLKVVKNKNGVINIDKSGKLPGRGAYVCLNKECIEKCIKNKSFNRAFKCNIETDLYDEIRKEFFCAGKD